MNEEQFIIYNTILQEIEMAVEVSISNLERSVLNDLMKGLEKNADLWKKIQNEILEANVTASSKLTLSALREDGFNQYCELMDKLFEV